MSMPSLAGRASFLIEHVYPPNRGPLTPAEIAEQLSANGDTVSEETVQDLLSGKLTDPPFNLIKGLAEIFKVRIDIFGDDEQAWAEAHTWILAMRERLNSPDMSAARALRRRDERRKQRAKRIQG